MSESHKDDGDNAAEDVADDVEGWCASGKDTFGTGGGSGEGGTGSGSLVLIGGKTIGPSV